MFLNAVHTILIPRIKYANKKHAVLYTGLDDSKIFPAINKTIPIPSSKYSLLSSELFFAFFASFCARTVSSRITTLTSGSMDVQIS